MSSPPKPWEITSTDTTIPSSIQNTDTLNGLGSMGGGMGYGNNFNSFGNGYNSFGGGYGSYGGFGGFNPMMNSQLNSSNPVLAKLQTFQTIISTFYSTAHVLESSYQFIMNIVYIFINMHEQVDGAKAKVWQFLESSKEFLLKVKNTNIKDIISNMYKNKPSINTNDFKDYIKNKDKHWNTLKLILSIIGTVYFIKRVAKYLMHVPIAKITKSNPDLLNLGLKTGDVVGILTKKLIDVNSHSPHSLARWKGKSIKIPLDAYELLE